MYDVIMHLGVIGSVVMYVVSLPGFCGGGLAPFLQLTCWNILCFVVCFGLFFFVWRFSFGRLRPMFV